VRKSTPTGKGSFKKDFGEGRLGKGDGMYNQSPGYDFRLPPGFLDRGKGQERNLVSNGFWGGGGDLDSAGGGSKKSRTVKLRGEGKKMGQGLLPGKAGGRMKLWGGGKGKRGESRQHGRKCLQAPPGKKEKTLFQGQEKWRQGMKVRTQSQLVCKEKKK